MIGSTVGIVALSVRNVVRIASFALASVLISGCASAKEIHWKEQVRLSTGEVIVVERGEKLRLVGEPGRGSGWLFDEAWLKAKLPGVGETVWQGALSPLALNVTSDGKWYLLGVVASYRGWKDYRLPERKRYVAFRLQEGTWRRVPFAEFPVEFDPNLLGDTYSVFITQGASNGTMVNFEMKRKVDSNPTLGLAYRRIDRSLGE